MSAANASDKKILSNTVFLYFRLLVLMAVSFYTSRILLQKLGVDDFGIYNIVGGVVSLFASLRGIFASSTQRFINISVGADNRRQLRQVYSNSILIHLCIALAFLLVCETAGLWFLHEKISIPPDRFQAALKVFQISIATSLVTIMTITYDALIIANERMKFYSYASLVEGGMKLGIIFLLVHATGDRLVFYAFLMFIVSLLNFLMYFGYCKHQFPDVCRLTRKLDTGLIREMSAFSGWNFLGNMSYSLLNEGINILLNLFGGVALNAARGITYQVRNTMMSLLNNLLLAFQPQVIGSYAQNDRERFHGLLVTSSRLLIYITICMAVPLFIWIDEILVWWLGVVPEHTAVFIRAILCYLLIRSLHGPADLFFKSIGKLKYYQMVELVTLSLPLLISWILLRAGCSPYWVFLAMAAMELVNLLCIVLLARRYDREVFRGYVLNVLLKPLGVLVLAGVLSYAGIYRISGLHFIINIGFSVILTVAVVAFAGLRKSERQAVLQFIGRKKK